MKLKPCPFCGNDLNQQDLWHDTIYPYNRQKTLWSVNCAEEVGGCSAQMMGSTIEDVVAKWNTRKTKG